MHMKKLLFILLSFLAFSIFLNAQCVFSNVEIILTQKDGDREMGGKDSEITPEDAPQTRGGVSQPVYAYLYNRVVTVAFQAVFSAVTVNITNKTTGETVYSEQFNNPASFSIDLNGEDTGDYMIEINSDEISLEGYLFL